MFFAWSTHRRRLLRVIAVASAAMLMSGCGGDSGREDPNAADTTTAAAGRGQTSATALDAALDKSFKQSGAPSVVAAVQAPGFTWKRALGAANSVSGQPITPEVFHRAGSVTKTFTATLLLQAEGDGLLSLDDALDRYVKGVPNGNKITLRQLATMTSGIATYSDTKVFPGDPGVDPYKVWKPEELVKIGIKDSPLFEPGTKFNYSNTNYVLLGLVLEKVTGKPIKEQYQENIFQPLGLEDTSFPDLADNSLADPHAQGYTLQGRSSGEKPRDATDWNPSWTWTAGMMISTVDDLLAYGRAMGTGKGLLAPSQQDKRIGSLASDVPPFDQPPLKGEFGYGVGLMKERGWMGHSGLVLGYTTALYYNPEIDTVVVVEVNSDIFSGDCPEDRPTIQNGPQNTPCDVPASRIFKTLTEALGEPARASR